MCRMEERLVGVQCGLSIAARGIGCCGRSGDSGLSSMEKGVVSSVEEGVMVSVEQGVVDAVEQGVP